MAQIELCGGADESAFALMMAELIRANLADHPEKLRDFAAMRGRVGLVAEDIQLAVTLRFRGGKLEVYAGLFGVPDLLVRGPSAALIDLSRLPPDPRVPFVPDLRSEVARSLARLVVARKLRVGGLTAHPGLALRLASVMSIYGEVSLEIEHKHPFAHDEAKQRARALADYMSARHGMSVAWNGDDSFQLRGKYMVVSIDIAVSVLPDKVQVHGQDPGMLWRSKAKSYITRKLEQYLDPAAHVDALPRA